MEGDATTLCVRCGEGAALYLGTQAFTKVYKSPNGIPCKQIINGEVEAGGLAVVLPDPVVPYARSVFEQEQTWHLGPDSHVWCWPMVIRLDAWLLGSVLGTRVIGLILLCIRLNARFW